MNPELSAFQIVELCTSIKQQYRTLSVNGEKRIKYVIYYQNPQTSQEWQQYAAGNSKDQSIDQFNEAFDYATQHLKGAIRVRIVFQDGHGKTLADQIIPITHLTNTITAPQNRLISTPEDVATVQQSSQTQPSQSFGNTFNMGALLGLMGFSGLQGTDDTPMGMLGAVLQVRDGIKDAQYERQELMHKLEETITDRALLKEKLAGAESQLATVEKQLEQTQDENDDLQDRIDELQAELQKRETISGFGTIAIQKLAGNIIKRNPEKVSRLLGISKEDMLGMIEGEAEQQPQPTQQPIPTVEVEQEDNSPRAAQLKVITDFCRTLSDADYQQLLAIFDIFRQDQRTIAGVFNLIKQMGSQSASDVEEATVVELED